ncbi:MAG TPA: addiction module protein [Verrucomicrobiae bacterium]|nr:addiction module protein [Verrucomicrobiae bacterium]
MTLDQIIEEARRWPPEQVAELVSRLTQELDFTPDAEEAWKVETRKRVAEIECGQAQGIPGETVSAEIRRIIGR